ncbi:hypothetical protein GCM10022215_17740 [Nocardioides fonticola]|uniref:WXG100 family type VII secretion target n=1 Tax=Nocardioides fonticola TaxID=450363 RepID=A0ABP7XIJ7_9ACTN
MTHRYPHLGFDPVASDETTAAEVAGRLRTTVDRLAEVDAVLSGTGDQQWVGRTAEAFRDSVRDELRPRVHDALTSFQQASRAFDRWVDQLPDYRRQADQLEQEALAAARAVSQAGDHLDGLQPPAADADDAARQQHQDDASAARTALEARRGELEDILRRAKTLKSTVEHHAGDVAQAFDTAARQAPDEPGLFGKLGEALGNIKDALGAAFDWFMENLAPLIQKLARIVGAIATILAIVAFVVGLVFPPAMALAGTLSTVAKVASFVDMGIQALRVVHGEDGALQGLAIQGAGMLVGISAAKALGPIAANAELNIQRGLFVPQISLAGGSTMGGASVATLSFAVNNDFFYGLGYWGITKYADMQGAFSTLEDETS